MSCIAVQGLTKRFGDFTAVDNISFAVEPGEVFGFLGPNGSGKSTTIRMLCGILRPTSGRAEVAGHDIFSEPDLVKRSIGYMSQRFSLYLELTAGENFEFFAGIYGLRPPEMAEARRRLFQRFGLSPLERVQAKDLPGGYRQRLALSCAVAHRPRVLFLDEPTAGVDPAARRAFWETVQSLAGEGMACLVSTHYLDEAEYAGRLAFIYQGKLAAVDTPRALKQAYRLKLYELTGPPPLEAMEKLSGLSGSCQMAPFGNALHLSCRQDLDPRPLVRRALEGRPHRMDAIEPSLEDVFVSLIPG
jgi:ABC-2 type transport system ATP-binding protein